MNRQTDGQTDKTAHYSSWWPAAENATWFLRHSGWNWNLLLCSSVLSVFFIYILLLGLAWSFRQILRFGELKGEESFLLLLLLLFHSVQLVTGVCLRTFSRQMKRQRLEMMCSRISDVVVCTIVIAGRRKGRTYCSILLETAAGGDTFQMRDNIFPKIYWWVKKRPRLSFNSTFFCIQIIWTRLEEFLMAHDDKNRE